MPTTLLHNETYADALKRRFDEEAFECVKEQWINTRIEGLMKDPVGLLCEVSDCNALLLATLKAVTSCQHSAAQAELNDQLYAYARQVAKHEWTKEQAYLTDLNGWN